MWEIPKSGEFDRTGGSTRPDRTVQPEIYQVKKTYNYSTDNLTRAVYQYQLQRQQGVTLNLDYSTTGVGCDACYVLAPYQTKPVAYQRDITIRPIRGDR